MSLPEIAYGFALLGILVWLALLTRYAQGIARPGNHLAKLIADVRAVAEESHRNVRALDADVDDLFDRMKRLTSRKGMAAKREADATRAASGAPLPGETGEEWKARMRRERAGKSNGKAEGVE